MNDKTNNLENKNADSSSSVDDSKRESLKKMGKRAAYISPVVLTMLTSQKATALSPPGP
jgi:hypothetical protein